MEFGHGVLIHVEGVRIVVQLVIANSYSCVSIDAASRIDRAYQLRRREAWRRTCSTRARPHLQQDSRRRDPYHRGGHQSPQAGGRHLFSRVIIIIWVNQDAIFAYFGNIFHVRDER